MSATTRRAWIIGGSALTAFTLVWATFTAIGLVAHEEETITGDFDAAALASVDVGTENGSIEVVATDEATRTGTIRLEGEITHGLRRTGHRAEIEGDTLVVRSSCPLLSQWCEADYRLEVPAALAVRADVDNGNLVVRDVDGPVHVDSDNGDVELTRLGGDIVASTDNGGVVATGLRSQAVDADSDNGSVSLTFAEPPRRVEATTENGSVAVIVPDDDTTYLVDIDTDHGGTDIGVRTDPTSDRLIFGRSHNGSVTVRYPTG